MGEENKEGEDTMGVSEGFWWPSMVEKAMGELGGACGGSGWPKND